MRSRGVGVGRRWVKRGLETRRNRLCMGLFLGNDRDGAVGRCGRADLCAQNQQDEGFLRNISPVVPRRSTWRSSPGAVSSNAIAIGWPTLKVKVVQGLDPAYVFLGGPWEHVRIVAHLLESTETLDVAA